MMTDKDFYVVNFRLFIEIDRLLAEGLTRKEISRRTGVKYYKVCKITKMISDGYRVGKEIA